jgi:aflatoxin B1 aldehyde reductase
LAEAAFRWLAHHSCLDPSKGDGILIGASSMEQLEQNLSAPGQGVLPEAVVSAFSAAWEEARPDSPEYFNFYSG